MIIGGLDLETTGLLAPEHRIIEICLSKYDWDGSASRLIETKTQRINPQRPIDAKAAAVHGIFETDLIGKPIWKDVASEVSNDLNACDMVVAHNGLDFDFMFVVQELDRVNVDIPDFIPFDTMTQGRWSTPLGKAPNLRELCWACGVDYDPKLAHAAEYDVARMMDCFFFGIHRGTYIIPV